MHQIIVLKIIKNNYHKIKACGSCHPEPFKAVNTYLQIHSA